MRYSPRVTAAIEKSRKSALVIGLPEVRQHALDIGMLVERGNYLTLHNGLIPVSPPGKCDRQLIELRRGGPLDLLNASRLSFGSTGMRVSWRAEIGQWGTVRYLVQVDNGFNLQSNGCYEMPDTLLLAWLGLSSYEEVVLEWPLVEILAPPDTSRSLAEGLWRSAREVGGAIDMVCFAGEIPVGTPEGLVRLKSG